MSRWVDTDTAADITGLTSSQIRRLAALGRIPFRQRVPNAPYRFEVGQLTAWQDAHHDLPRRHSRHEVIAEVQHLIEHRHPTDIAQALGYASPASISRTLYRAGRNDLARHFNGSSWRRTSVDREAWAA